MTAFGMYSLKTPLNKLCSVSFNCKPAKVEAKVDLQETYLLLYFTRTSVTISHKEMKIFLDTVIDSGKLIEEFLLRLNMKFLNVVS